MTKLYFRPAFLGLLCLVILAPASVVIRADEASATHLAAIARVGPDGVGANEAQAARTALAKQGLELLPALLVAMDTRNVVAANWYRTVYEEIVARESAKPATTWPVEFLKSYVNDSRRAGRPRRLALALLDRAEPAFRAAWLPTRLDDPEFGFEAVVIATALGDQALKDKQTDVAKQKYRQAFEHARDSAQVAVAAAKLKSLGESADTISHLGLIVDWWLLGPFDAPEKTGFATVFPPESSVDLKAAYIGKGNREIRWLRHRTPDRLGQLNLIDALGTTREAVGYAYAEFDVPEAREAQVRCGADDNGSIWLNGHRVFAREQWLNGTRFDRFTAPISLTAGRNTLLVKVCQGPQHKDPEVPNNWSLQLRLCDEQGRGLAFRSLLPEPIPASPK